MSHLLGMDTTHDDPGPLCSLLEEHAPTCARCPELKNRLNAAEARTYHESQARMRAERNAILEHAAVEVALEQIAILEAALEVMTAPAVWHAAESSGVLWRTAGQPIGGGA